MNSLKRLVVVLIRYIPGAAKGGLLYVAMAISSKASTITSAFVPLVLCLALFSCQIKGGLARGRHKPPGPGGALPAGPGGALLAGPGGRHKPRGAGIALGTVFNVLQFGARPGVRESQSQVKR